MELQPLLALVIGIAIIIVLIIRTRIDAFIALLLAAIAVGLIAGLPMGATTEAIVTGFGNTLGSIGIVIGLGVMIGKLLEVSGGADSLANAFLRAVGRGRESWAMAGTGSVVSIPVFCDSGYVIMHPLARSLSRTAGKSFVMLALALGAGMTITHHLVPPTPGPLAVAGILDVDLGTLIVAGLLFSIPMVPTVVFYAKWIGPKLDAEVDAEVRRKVDEGESAPTTDGGGTATQTETRAEPTTTTTAAPGALRAFLPLLVPLILIVGNTVTEAVAPEAGFAEVAAFLGDPVVALIIGALIAIYALVPAATGRKQVQSWLGAGAASAGLIILITGAGGALGEVLRESGVGDALAEAVLDLAIPAYLIPFLVATLVRFAQGSGTVAMITGASLTAPLLGTLGLDPTLAALGILVGSIFFSYYNDSYFWVVTKFTGLEGTAALKGWSGITTALWAVGFICLTIASFVL
ncbi:GntP family permease [Egibacter rhizosphaerae]|uniref:GntP family permease n=1 Tax=Egibacter rhizosphaerae TaxID=1670831 RepID=A0A411YKH2_9ACTN|nr:SLC13 family permease [Egibacter rhizosphaerae]QBI21683.1 GntP family permease [Egibacter rhizosphaerae]